MRKGIALGFALLLAGLICLVHGQSSAQFGCGDGFCNNRPASISVWTPASITGGLLAWYRASVGVTTSGGNVTVVLDQSGNGYNLSPVGTVPFNATGLNGGPSFDFNKTGGFVTTTDAVTFGTGVLFSVFASGQMNGATGVYGMLAGYIATGEPNTYGGTGNSGSAIGRNAGADAILGFRGGSPVGNASVSQDVTMRMGGVYDGTNFTPYVNNVAGTTSAATANFATPGTLVFGQDSIGAGTLFWQGPIGQFVITKTAIGSSDRALLETYLAANPQ